MINISEVSQRIDLIRRQNNWTQGRLAEALQLSQPAVSKYLKERIPPAETLLRLAKIGNTTIEWILTGQKSYWYQASKSEVAEDTVSYDAEYTLAKKIALLPLEIRKAIT
ncbi:MAG: helix-turn-helix transcriptional regulator, partial [Calditrichaceae bacterium]|nr:helix-turn-helix transcriptional regulator [Calditrichaceae bacterium]